MGVPKRKRSRARRDSRLAHKGIKVGGLATCKNCQTALVSHQICPGCGFYKGVKVTTTKIDRKIKRATILKAQYDKRESRELKAKANEGSAE
jgi:large subunit ribosomal protein L32